MLEKIQDLNTQLKKIIKEYLVYQKKENIEEVKQIIPQIQEFVLWFLKENRFQVEEQLYQEMTQNLIYILKDILEAIQNRDCVLMHDALAYGLIEYLGMFIMQENDLNDNI